MRTIWARERGRCRNEGTCFARARLFIKLWDWNNICGVSERKREEKKKKSKTSGRWVWEWRFDICLDFPRWSAVRECVLEFSFRFSSLNPFLSAKCNPTSLKKQNKLSIIQDQLSSQQEILVSAHEGGIAKTWWRGQQQQIDSPQTFLVVLASSQNIRLDAVYYRLESIHPAVTWTQALKYNNNLTN